MHEAIHEAHLLTRKQAAAYLAVCERKLDQMAASGALPRIKMGKSIRFERADLEAFITARKSA